MKNPISRILSTRQFNRLRSLGLIDEMRLRNLIIQQEYDKLVSSDPRTGRGYRSLLVLAEKYHLSFELLRDIIYKKKYRGNKS